jgi:hypothetical protein
MRRRRQPQSEFLCAATCLLLCACTEGKGTPLRLADGGGEDSEAGSGGTTTSTAGHSGARAIDASVDIDDEPMLNSKCRDLEKSWSAAYTADEKKLVDELNELRADPNGFCATLVFAPPEPLVLDPVLRCAARMRFEYSNGPKSNGGSPTLTPTYFSGQRSQEQMEVRQREKDAEATRIEAEIVFTNMSSAEGLRAALDSASSDPQRAAGFCWAVMQTWKVGIARSGSVWVADFGRGSPSSTRPPTGTGPSGPGNSGTGGR